jgi:hypothetical protein
MGKLNFQQEKIMLEMVTEIAEFMAYPDQWT